MINFNLFKNGVCKCYILSPKILPDVLEKQASCVVYRVRHDICTERRGICARHISLHNMSIKGQDALFPL